MMTAKEISRQLALRAEEVASYLLPQGVTKGNEFCVGSINGESGKSLKIHLKGDKAGIWCDFSGTNKGGDLLDLWAATRNISLRLAIKETSQYLGISAPTFVRTSTSQFTKPSFKAFKKLTDTSLIRRYLIDERKLSSETISAFKISEKDNAVVFPYYRDNQLIQVKYISLKRDENGKKIAWTEKNCEPCLYGWQAVIANTRSITITEGEIDAMSLFQYGYPTLSVPFGGGTGDKHRWLEYEFDRLSIYDVIYLCFDNDESGKAATSYLAERLGAHRCYIVRLPKKDANACLQAGIIKEKIKQCFDGAVTLDPEELKSANLFVDQVINEFYPSPDQMLGYNPPWNKTKGKILFRPEELSVWTGINGHGKSQFLGHLILQFMKDGARVCIASLELKPKRLLMRLTRQAGALKDPSPEYIRAIHDWYGDKLWIFDLVGTAKTKRLLEVFLYARQRYGIDVFIIDSLMKLDVDEEDFSKQKTFIGDLCDFKNQHACHIHVVTHPRKRDDESQIPGKLDIRGAGAITDLADNCFIIWRNKQKEKLLQFKTSGRALTVEQQEKLKDSDCFWCCEKQRNGDWEGKFGFWFHPGSLQYLSLESQKPICFVDYSNHNA